MHRRLNITLSDETVRLLDRLARKGERSRVIAEAVEQYVVRKGRATVRKRIREGSRARASRDVALAEEWFNLEEEAWRGRKRK